MIRETLGRQVQQLAILQSGFSLVRNPNNLKEVLKLSDRLTEYAQPEDIRKFSESLCKDPKAVKAIEQRYRIDHRDIKRLARCRKGSLGHAYLSHLEASGISPESLIPPVVTDDFSYVIAHLYETHDIWHTVTGFDTTIAGELGLASFGAAQLPSQFDYLLLAGGLLNTVFYEFDDRDNRMTAIADGWKMGKAAKPFFGIRWDELWETPISKVRRNTGVAAA